MGNFVRLPDITCLVDSRQGGIWAKLTNNHLSDAVNSLKPLEMRRYVAR